MQSPLKSDEQFPNFIEIEPILDKTLLQRKLEGDIINLDPKRDLKSQVQKIPYNRQREIKRSNFQLEAEIGGGSFGKVFKGQLVGLQDNRSKTTVAIKTIHENGNANDLGNLLSEIKIMSHINPHVNLVSMIGSCTSQLQENAELWLIIEFCEHGDLKNYVHDNQSKILNGRKNETLNSRCLIQWAYDVAKGMEYLAEHKIMHGDLASRNILLSKKLSGNGCPIAKVCDFGLAKRFYDAKEYRKSSRMLVPWKWMAIEYLKNNYFTLQSDVWSYGVLLWEILSFGQSPYGQQEFDEVLKKLEKGYRLPCPTDVQGISSWSPVTFYEELSAKCFVTDPKNRVSFSIISKLIEEKLLPEEKTRYSQTQELYQRLKANNYLNIGNR